MMIRSFGKLVSYALLCSMPSLVIAQAVDEQDQDQDQASQKKSQSKRPEKFTVTGSRLKKIDLEGPNPVITIDQEDISRSGYSTLEDMLNRLPQLSFGSVQTSGGNGDADFQGVNLRGLGSGNTLILLNGKRLHRDPAFQSTDLSQIPMAAVEKVDILFGTASAIYGSDAIGGVVNVVTKKNYTGNEVYFFHSEPSWGGGEVDMYSYVRGTATEKSRSVNVLSYRFVDKILSASRDFDNTFRPISAGVPATYIDDNNQRAVLDPTQCKDGADSRPSARGTICVGDYADTLQARGQTERINFLSHNEYDLSDSEQIYSLISASKRTSWSGALPPFVTEGSSENIVIPAARVQELIDAGQIPTTGPGAVATARDLKFRTLFEEAGIRETVNVSHLFGLQAGYKRQIGLDSELEVSIADSRTFRRTDWGVFLMSGPLQDIINDGTFDPLAPAGQRGDISRALAAPSNSFSSAQTLYQAVFTSSFDLGIEFNYALGVQRTFENYKNSSEPLVASSSLVGLGGGYGQGVRSQTAVFGEFSMKPFKWTEFTGAIRTEEFSDFGTTTNPQVGLKVTPLNSLMIRATYGTGFKAPTLQDINDPEARFFTQVRDTKLCREATAANNQVNIDRFCEDLVPSEIIGGGNSDLEAEESESINAGIMYAPMKNLSFSATYWQTNIKNRIGSMPTETLMEFEADGRALPSGASVERDPTTGEVTRIRNPIVNTAAIKQRGFDASLQTRLDFGKRQYFSFKADYSRVDSILQEQIKGQGFVEIIGEAGLPRWRLNNTFIYGINTHAISLINFNIPGYEQSDAAQGQVAHFRRWDFNYKYDTPWDGTIVAGYRNIFQKDPPLDGSNGNAFNGSLFDIEGPTAYFSYAQRF